MSPSLSAALARAKAMERELEDAYQRSADAEGLRLARLARWQAPPLSRGWPDGMP